MSQKPKLILKQCNKCRKTISVANGNLETETCFNCEGIISKQEKRIRITKPKPRTYENMEKLADIFE